MLFRSTDVVEAKKLEHSRESQQEIAAWCGGTCGLDGGVVIRTLEGRVVANTGSYVVKQKDGRFYIHDSHSFEKQYAPL